ncbi:hypothetical protein N9I36_01190 [Planktomarina temperata]|nr:hypothetical protein [Planktomarina temperata]
MLEKISRQMMNAVLLVLIANHLSVDLFSKYNLLLVNFALLSPLIYFVQEAILINVAHSRKKMRLFLSFQTISTIFCLVGMIALKIELFYYIIWIIPLTLFRKFEYVRFENFVNNHPNNNGLIDLVSYFLILPLKFISIYYSNINLLIMCVMLDYIIPSIVCFLLEAKENKIYLKDFRIIRLTSRFLKFSIIISFLCLPALLSGVLQAFGTRYTLSVAESELELVALGALFLAVRLSDFFINGLNIFVPLIQVKFKFQEKNLKYRIGFIIKTASAIVFAAVVCSPLINVVGDRVFPIYWYEIEKSQLFLLSMIVLMSANIIINITHYEKSQTGVLLIKSIVLVLIMFTGLFGFVNISLTAVLALFSIAYLIQLVVSFGVLCVSDR